MPYIAPERRLYVDPVTASDFERAKTAGELNYQLTMMIKDYLADKTGYQHYNDVLGALEGCKLEFYRRMVAPYEDVKKELNGDVYE
jgi:hypothetical protein